MQLLKGLAYAFYGLFNSVLFVILYKSQLTTTMPLLLFLALSLVGWCLLAVALKYKGQLEKLIVLNNKMAKRLNTQVTQEAQHLKLAALGRFSASIAHELRNPLGAISHAIQLLGDDKGLNEEDERLKQLVIKNCDRMNAVIKNVLQLTRRQPSQPQMLEVLPFLEQFKQDFCQSNPCELTIKVPDEALQVSFDKSQLEQILVILCDNSRQHGQDDEGIARIQISAVLSENNTLLTLRDKGPGISKKHSDDIFDPFFTTLRGGTGMGLYIAKDLCEMNQAKLSLEKSTVGSCFAITINP